MMERYFTPYTATQLTGKHFAVVAPHPDDEVFGCGGTLALAAQNGISISVLILSDGAGQPGEAETTRQEESKAAGAILGYDNITFWNLPDGHLNTQQELNTHIAVWLETIEPDSVFFPSVWEMHRDHRAAAEATLDACQKVKFPIRGIMYEIGCPLQPNCLVDITSTLAAKQTAMSIFLSQLKHQAYDRHISGLNSYRSYTLGKETLAAEAFKLLSANELDSFAQRYQQSSASEAMHQALDDIRVLQERLTAQTLQLQQQAEELEAMKKLHTWPLIRLLRKLQRLFRLSA